MEYVKLLTPVIHRTVETPLLGYEVGSMTHRMHMPTLLMYETYFNRNW